MLFTGAVEVVPCPRCSLGLVQTQRSSSTCSETPPFLPENFPPFGMQFNPAAGRAHTAVPPAIAARKCPVAHRKDPARPLCWAQEVLEAPQHSSPSTPAALLTTATVKMNWELKGYTKGFSADVQTLSIILPVLCRKNSPTLHTRPKRKRLHYSHLAGSACRSLYVLSPAQGSLF